MASALTPEAPVCDGRRGQELRNVQHIERKGVNKSFRKDASFRRLQRIVPLRGAAQLRSVVVQGNDSLEPPIRGKRDLLDAHFGILEEFVAPLL
jgi:hypothetical protein